MLNTVTVQYCVGRKAVPWRRPYSFIYDLAARFSPDPLSCVYTTDVSGVCDPALEGPTAIHKAIHTAGAMLCVVSVLLVAPLSLACPQPAVMDATAVSRILWKTRDLFQTDLHAVIRCGAGIPKFKLCYLPCRNRVEIARLILEEAQCAYDFEVVGFRQWAEYVKQQTPHGKCPVLRDYDGSGQVLDQEGQDAGVLVRS